MRVFTANFAGHWPVGAAAVVVAEDEIRARTILAEVLAVQGLKLKEADAVTELPTDISRVRVLCDGNY